MQHRSALRGIAILVIAAAALTGCSSAGAAQEGATEPTASTGAEPAAEATTEPAAEPALETWTSADGFATFDYPAGWTVAHREIMEAPAPNSIIEDAVLRDEAGQIQLYFFDTEGLGGACSPEQQLTIEVLATEDAPQLPFDEAAYQEELDAYGIDEDAADSRPIIATLAVAAGDRWIPTVGLSTVGSVDDSVCELYQVALGVSMGAPVTWDSEPLLSRSVATLDEARAWAEGGEHATLLEIVRSLRLQG